MRRIVLILAAALAGCGGMPQNADEFRRAVPGAFLMGVQSFEVNRSVRDVGRTFQARAPQCLNVSVRTVSQTSTSYQNIVAAYKPTVVVTDAKAELHVQRKYVQGVITPGKEPEGGHYMLVADATPIDRGRSKIDIYGPTRGADAMIKAITAWANGTSTGCPDLTKN
jgi:hypothetical protein